MSPEIDWQVRDDHGYEETIAAAPKPTRHWRVSLIALMMVLGINLGTLYASVKEPAPRPTPTPSITPSPVPPPLSLIEMIDREAQALADGDFKTFLSLQDQSDPVWYQWQSRNFRAWGRPPLDNMPLYYFLGPQPDDRPRDHIGLDTSQFRTGGYFRETRFYRLQNDQWRRSAPDPSFWSESYQTSRTQHFSLAYPIEDSELISTVLDQFETTYDRICTDLNCPAGLVLPLIDAPLGRVPQSINLPAAIVLSSPRIDGVYTPIRWLPGLVAEPPTTVLASDKLTPILVEWLSGYNQRSASDGRGGFWLQAVETWELNRLSPLFNSRIRPPQPSGFQQLLPPKQLANNIDLIKLESLWTMENVPSNPEQVANSVIFFIEQKYGVDSVAKFLKAIGPADSFKQAIENSLGVNEIQFEQQWREWLKQFYNQGN